VLRSVNGLKHAKNDGECEVTSDCFIHAHTALFIHLAMLMTSMFSHGFIIRKNFDKKRAETKALRQSIQSIN
jgi:NhaP-type Na+/H+ or K+/H+ antiporter